MSRAGSIPMSCNRTPTSSIGATLMLTIFVKNGFHDGRYPGVEFSNVSPVSMRNRPLGCSTSHAKIGEGGPTQSLQRMISSFR